LGENVLLLFGKNGELYLMEKSTSKNKHYREREIYFCYENV